MGKVEDAVASFERNIEIQTGRSVEAWAGLVSDRGFQKHGQMVGWLKEEHTLSHSHANHIAKRVLREASPPPVGDPVAPLFAGAKAGLRPTYDRLVEIAMQFGGDVASARAIHFDLTLPRRG